jgi:hypothetical protein
MKSFLRTGVIKFCVSVDDPGEALPASELFELDNFPISGSSDLLSIDSAQYALMSAASKRSWPQEACS